MHRLAEACLEGDSGWTYRVRRRHPGRGMRGGISGGRDQPRATEAGRTGTAHGEQAETGWLVA